jgi:hypothetical protein
VKITIRHEDASALEMNDWLAELRDGESAEPTAHDHARPAAPGRTEPAGPGPAAPGRTEPAGPGPGGPGYAVPASYSHAVPASPDHGGPPWYVRAVPAGPGYAVPAGQGRAEPAAGSARPEAPAAPAVPVKTATLATPAGPAAPAAPASRAGAAVRAVIGDQLRIPIMWCEMGSCISWYSDSAALGEADTRARAIAAGWRIDALGRLACPRCQQDDPGFWAACPVVPWDVVPWDTDTALARTAPMPAAPGGGISGRAAPRSRSDPGRAARGYPPPSGAELDWSHDSPADEAMPAGRYAENQAGTSHSVGAVFKAVRGWRARPGRQAAPSQPVSTARTR